MIHGGREYMSKLSDYLGQHKIDSRRLLVASQDIDALRPEDRAIRLARAGAKDGDEKAKERAQAVADKKRRSGRVISQPALRRALGGQPLTRKARARIVRAVNTVLGKKGKNAATAADLF
jgi:hypothetical protein